MNYTDYRLSLDIFKTASQATLPVKQGDTAYRLCITITSNGSPYIIEEGCYAVFTAKKPDGRTINNECRIGQGIPNEQGIVTEEKNTIYYHLTPQTTSAIGVVECEVVLYDSQDMRLATPHFNIFVDKKAYNGEDIESLDENKVLDSIYENAITASKAKLDAETAKTEAEEAATNAQGHSNDAEEASSVATEQAEIAKQYATLAENAQDAAGSFSVQAEVSAGEAENAATQAEESARSAASYAQNAFGYAEKAEIASESALEAVTDAQSAKNEAELSANEAKSVLKDGKNLFSNALKGNSSGISIGIGDASPIEHDAIIKTSSDTVTVCGKNLIDYRKAIKNTYDDVLVFDDSINGIIFSGLYCLRFPLDTIIPAGSVISLSAKSEYFRDNYCEVKTTDKVVLSIKKIKNILLESDIEEVRFFKTNSGIREENMIFTDIQLEIGAEPTEYTDYKNHEVIEVVNGVAEVPIKDNFSVISTDANTTVEYNRDINKAFEELKNAILSLGGKEYELLPDNR